jgi:hypothetical protein
MGDTVNYLGINDGDTIPQYETDLIGILDNDMSLNDISTNIMNINQAFNTYLQNRGSLNNTTKTDIDEHLLQSYKSNMGALNELNKQRYEKYNKMRNILTSLKNENGYLEIQKNILLGNVDNDAEYLGEIANTQIKIDNMKDNVDNSERHLEVKRYQEKKLQKQNSLLKYAISLVSMLILLSIIYKAGLMSDTIFYILVGLIIAYIIIYIFIEIIDILWRDRKYFDEYDFGGSPNRGLTDLEKGIVTSEDDDVEYCDEEEEDVEEAAS